MIYLDRNSESLPSLVWIDRVMQLLTTAPFGRYPTLVAFCNGDEALQIRFEEEFKPSKIVRFLQHFEDQQTCAKMIKIDASTDLSSLTVSQLKSFLKDRGESCLECTEKKDYIQRLKDLLTSGVKSEL